jgi:hypothetical protein
MLKNVFSYEEGLLHHYCAAECTVLNFARVQSEGCCAAAVMIVDVESTVARVVVRAAEEWAGPVRRLVVEMYKVAGLHIAVVVEGRLVVEAQLAAAVAIGMID